MRAPALALLAAALPAAASPPADWHAQVDNDVAFHTDRWYTSGVRIYRSVRLDGDAPALPGMKPYRMDLGVIHEVYTGDGRAAPGRADRPNTGRLQLSVARHDLADDTLATWGIDAGVRGPAALAEELQDLVHRIAPAPETDWTRQAANRADLQAVASASHRIALGALPGSLVLHAGGVAGTVLAFGHAGLEWRSDSPAHAPSTLLRFAATPPMPRPAPGLAFFAGASVRAVGRNRLFESRGDDPREAPALRRRVTRLAAGVAWSGAWGALTAGLAQDSREFAGQPSPHRFASLSFSIPAD